MQQFPSSRLDSTQQGIDKTFHGKFLKYAQKKGLEAYAQVLWQGALQHEGNSAHKTCPKCGRPFTLLHILYECEWIMAAHGAVPAMWWPFHLDVEQQHFWLRGLVPLKWTQQALPTEEVQATGVFTQADLDGSLYWFGTDGSGGPHSNDPRMRRCAWSVVALDSQLQVVASLSGMLTGTANQHTVPRAEARAFLALLQATSNEIKVAVDAKYVCKGWWNIQHPHRVQLDALAIYDLWRDTWEHRHRDGKITKVKSHQEEAAFLQTKEQDLLWVWKAKEAADVVCTAVAGDYAAQHIHPGIVDWIDSRAWKLNKFLAERG